VGACELLAELLLRVDAADLPVCRKSSTQMRSRAEAGEASSGFNRIHHGRVLVARYRMRAPEGTNGYQRASCALCSGQPSRRGAHSCKVVTTFTTK
jgi:hypothetical protein